MSEQKPRIGKKGAAKELTKKFTEIRKAPVAKRAFEIVEENFNRAINQKKIAKSNSDLEA